MKISVCIPTYNSERYIRECIASVLEQTGVEFEVVISDNASQDRTWEIVQSFAGDGRIRAVRSERNLGMAANFNAALWQAKGEYIKLLCSDDLLEPGTLELQSAFLDDHAEAVMITGGRRLIDSTNNIQGTIRWFSETVAIAAPQLKVLSLMYGNVIGEPSAVLFRRDAWVKAGPFQEGLVTFIDLDMWFRLGSQGKIGYVPSPSCRIRRHALSMTNHFRGTGEVQGAILELTKELLRDLDAGPLVRRISLGKVAGSHIRHALYGLRNGEFRWPALALVTAFRNDPGFIGLLSYLSLFRSGLLGLRIGSDGKPCLCSSSTLRSLPTVQ
jgi:glycosyltransferase involved in cell wall biosynthesis